MGWMGRSLCWSLILAALTLPLLSLNGYAPSTTEYLLSASACAGGGLMLGALSRFNAANSVLVFMALVLLVAEYFAAPALWHARKWVPYALCIAIGAFSYASWRFPREMLIVFAAGAGTHAISSVMFSPSMVITETKPASLPPGDNAPVIHVVLDEHAGLAAIPVEVMPAARRDAFVRRYVDRGFLVFTHAYTADTFSSNSMARLFNPQVPNPKSLVKDQQVPSGWSIERAALLEDIAARREVMIFGTAVVNLAPALRAVPNATFVQNLVPTHAGPDQLRSGLAWDERVKYAYAKGMNWLRADFDSPLFTIAFRFLPLEFKEVGLDTRLFYLDMSFASLAESTHGSWYAFIHVLLPHVPYIYDGDCAVRPRREWASRFPMHTPEWRMERYASHLKQAECASGRVLRELEVFARRRDWAETAVVIHGDHGSRIALEDRAAWPDIDNAKGRLAMDIYATFLAVRLPGARKGALVDAPVRVDDVFAHLVKSNFRTLDVDSLPRRPHPF